VRKVRVLGACLAGTQAELVTIEARFEEEDRDRTEVTITEDGEVYNPIFRFMSAYVFGHTATIEQYLTDLESRVQ